MKSLVCPICQMDNALSVNERIADGCNLAALAKELIQPYHVLYYHSLHHMPRGLNRRGVKDQELILEDMVKTRARLEEIFQQSARKNNTATQLKVLAELRAMNEQGIKISANLEQARRNELEAERLRRAPTEDMEAREREYHEKLRILTRGELKLVLLIEDKVRRQAAQVQIIPDSGDLYESINARYEKLIRGEDQDDIAEVRPVRMVRLNGKERPISDN